MLGRDANGLNPARNLPKFGSPTYTSSVPPNSGSALAMNFNGTADGHFAGQVTNVVDNFGIEAWVNPAASAVSQQIVIHNGAPFNGDGYGFEILNGNYAGDYGAFRPLDTGVAATPGVWRHLALVRASGVTTIYLDGAVVYQNSSLAAPATPNGSFTLGRAPGGTNGLRATHF